MRVKVFSGDKRNFIGYGRIVGWVTAYAIRSSKGGSLIIPPNPEEKPTEEFLDNYKGGRLLVLTNHPKIELDKGGIVYDCQVWWEPENLDYGSY